MDSFELVIVMGAVCCFAMAVVGIIAAKGNATIDHLARNAQRTQERNDAARDRFYQSLIEKTQVNGDPDAAVKLAQLHANEGIRRATDGYRHDHAVESIDRATEKRQHRQHQRAVDVEKMEAMATAADGM